MASEPESDRAHPAGGPVVGPPVGRRVQRLRKAQRLSQRDLAAAVRVSKAWVGQVERGDIASPGGPLLERVAEVLGVGVDALLAAAPGPLDAPQSGVSAGGAVALLSASGKARYYPGYPLWAREDPRTEAAARAALRPGRRVMCEADDGFPPESVDVVRVDDPGPLRIATAQGVVGAGWRLFVDRARAATAAPGDLVAAMTRRGDVGNVTELAVGELGRDAAGAWTLKVGRARRPIERDDVLGVVHRYQAPPAQYGWVLEDEAPDPRPPAAGGA